MKSVSKFLTIYQKNQNYYSLISNLSSKNTSKNFSFLNYVEKDMGSAYSKKGTRLGIFFPKQPKEISFEGMNNYNKDLLTIADGLVKTKKFHYHPLLTIRKKAKRLLEIPQPSYIDLHRRKERRRKQDRAVVRAFCRKVLYLHQKYLPQIGRTVR